MCYNSDLFGDVIVTVDEVNIWLDASARLHGRSLTRRNYYANNYKDDLGIVLHSEKDMLNCNLTN